MKNQSLTVPRVVPGIVTVAVAIVVAVAVVVVAAGCATAPPVELIKARIVINRP
jgi:hypothetical protein